jgi:hypothetical protein
MVMAEVYVGEVESKDEEEAGAVCRAESVLTGRVGLSANNSGPVSEHGEPVFGP